MHTLFQLPHCGSDSEIHHIKNEGHYLHQPTVSVKIFTDIVLTSNNQSFVSWCLWGTVAPTVITASSQASEVIVE